MTLKVKLVSENDYETARLSGRSQKLNSIWNVIQTIMCIMLNEEMCLNGLSHLSFKHQGYSENHF